MKKMDICYFNYFILIFVIFSFFSLSDADVDVTFRAKDIETMVIFTFDRAAPGNNEQALSDYIEYFANFISMWKGGYAVDFDNIPLQIHFGAFNSTDLMNAADDINSTAAMVVLKNNEEFIKNVTHEVTDYIFSPLETCYNTTNTTGVPVLCDLVWGFVNVSRDPLTKLNLAVFSNVCPHPDSFQKFHDTVNSQIAKAVPASAFLITNYDNCTYPKQNVTVIKPFPVGNPVDSYVHSFVNPTYGFSVNPMINFFNFFALITDENYNTTLEFMVNYIFNSSTCGPETTLLTQTKSYYIMMKIQYDIGFGSKYREISTVIPWLNFTQDKIDFGTYLKQNLDYQLNLPQSDIGTDNSPQKLNEQMQNIFVSVPMHVDGLNYSQYNIFFTDQFPNFIDNSLFYTNQAGRVLDLVFYMPEPNATMEKLALEAFYKVPYPNSPAINLVIINSTDPYETAFNPICKSYVESAKFEFHRTPVKLVWYVWVIIGVAVLAVIVIAANVLYWKFLRPKDPIDMIAQNFKLNEEEKKLFSNARDKLFIDESMVEVDYNVILGRGASSTVYKAIIKGIAPSLRPKKNLESAVSDDYIVAAKVSNQFGREQIEELIGEIEAARRLENHPNICALLGWSTHLGAPCLLFESMELDLLSYIKSLRVETGKENNSSETDSLSHISITLSEHYGTPDFDENQKKIFLQILWQASKGLEYIISKSIVHRDVAARNILLSRNGNTFTAKIADFGLCSDMDENTNIYRASFNKRLPIKWLALESLVDRTFSQASDVWAFGITMIEMYSCSQDLYAGIGLNEVTDFLKSGQRMDKPEKMPQEMYDIAFSCWHEEPSSRPTFLELRDQFEVMLRGMGDEGYLGINEEDAENFDGRSIETFVDINL